MDDPYLDSRSSKRTWEDRPRGPFEVNEPLPKPVQLWRDRTNKATNKPQELLHFGWQRNSAYRILESLELHSYEWTVKNIKTRECLDKQDRRDIAVSTFAMSRNKPALLPYAIELRALDLTREADNTAALRSVARENTRLLQIAALEEQIEDEDSPFVHSDRAALLSLCDMEPTELQIYTKMMDVYDKAKSHFLFDIVEVQVKRFLNAERLKAEAEQIPRCLSYAEYKELFMSRTQNSELTQDLLSYILKPREEGCPIYLWAAERISESNLLTSNGLAMSNQAWLAYTLAFITPDERQVLNVPSFADRSTYDNGRGYALSDLEEAIAAIDVTTLKRFRQAACNDPVALQILALLRPREASSSSQPSGPRKPRFAPRLPTGAKESFAAETPAKAGKSSPRPPRPPPGNLAQLDQPSQLPHKDGKVDMTQYAKYKEGGLRQKIHKAIRAKQCIRCWSSDHLRSSCTEPPKKWEEDYNKGKDSFWSPKPHQSRPQWICPSRSPDAPGSRTYLLFAQDAGRRIALDTCSDISIGRFDVLKNVRFVQNTILVEGVGGKCLFDLEGEFSLDGTMEVTVFAVGPGDLPPDSLDQQIVAAA